jgi:tetratricopeptide (TPR) repeat protein
VTNGPFRPVEGPNVGSAVLIRLARLYDHAKQHMERAGIGVSQKRLAEQSNVPVSTVNSWATGASLPRDLDQLTAVGGILAGWAGEPPPGVREWSRLLEQDRSHAKPRPVPPELGGLSDRTGGQPGDSGAVSGASDQHAVDWARGPVLGQEPPYPDGTDPGMDAVVSVAIPLGLRDSRLPLRGRDELLAELAVSGPEVIVLYGLGGCGKTRLAVEAALEAQQRHNRRVWWVSAAQPGALETGMQAVARHLGAGDADLACGMAADETWRRLEAYPDRWVLVIDNADDPQVLVGARLSEKEGRGWLRPISSRNGLVLVTSRQGSEEAWAPWCRRVRLGMLPRKQAGEVLADFAGRHQELGGLGEAEALAARLGGLPLALKIAGSYLRDAATTPAVFTGQKLRSYTEYREAVERADLTASKHSGGEDLSEGQAQELIGTIWEPTRRLLEARPVPHAQAVLRLLASLGTAPIPYLLLDPGLITESSAFADITGPQLWQALTALADSGVADLLGNEEPAAVRLHPLVRDSIRPTAGAADQLELMRLAGRLLARAATQVPENPQTWPTWQLLASHASHVLAALTQMMGTGASDLEAAASAAYMAACYYRAQGWIIRAEALFRDVMAAQSRALGRRHPSTLISQHAVARLMDERGDLVGAEDQFAEILRARLEILGPDHPDTIVAQFNIAFVMQERGELANAEEAFRQVLAASSRVLGPRHLTTLMVQFEIAYTMAVRGNHDAAINLFREVQTAREKLLGPDHPETLNAWHRVAWARARRGDYAAAQAELEELLAAKLRVLGPDHRSTMATQYQLARAIGEQGHHSRAEAMFREILAKEPRILGPDHQHTLQTRYEIARMIGEYDLPRSLANHQEVLEDRLRVLGPDHPDTLVSRHKIACLMAELGNTAAETKLSEVLKDRLRVLGPGHPDTLSTMHRIACIQAHQGNYPAAKAGFCEVFLARRRILGPDHPDTLASQEEATREYTGGNDRLSTCGSSTLVQLAGTLI